MPHWTPFSLKVVIKANSRLSKRKHGATFALPKELLGIISFKPKTTEEIREAFRSASRRLRQE